MVPATDSSSENESVPELLHTRNTSVLLKSPSLPPL